MSDPFIGEIRMFAANFPPAGWALCQGQLLPIAENDALYTLIGTTYGGDGQSTFALPNLQSRVPLHQGAGYILGQPGGVEGVTITGASLPKHNHVLACSGNNGTQSNPPGNVPGAVTAPLIYRAGEPNAPLSPSALPGQAGGNEPHNNIQPYLAINFIISLFGIFPPPN